MGQGWSRAERRINLTTGQQPIRPNLQLRVLLGDVPEHRNREATAAWLEVAKERQIAKGISQAGLAFHGVLPSLARRVGRVDVGKRS